MEAKVALPLVSGRDRNTIFFHIIAHKHKATDRIKILLINGNFSKVEDEIKKIEKEAT